MNLTPREKDKLLIAMAAMVARRRLERGVKLNYPEAIALIGQSPLSKERLDRAPRLRAVFNVESNFLPNVDYDECHRRGMRCVRVVHGKGLGSPGRQPVLKGKVQRWLAQSAEVIAFAQASGPQGGAGALVVLLAGLSR